jgi:hypothetical protein
MKRFLLGLLFASALTPLAAAQPFSLTATSDVHPGDNLVVHATGAPPRARIAIFASLHLGDGVTLGPRDTRCGTIEIHLEIGPPVRLLGSGQTDASGEFGVRFEMPRRLPARLDGVIIYSQAAAAAIRRTEDGGCEVRTGTSNVARTTIHVP